MNTRKNELEALLKFERPITEMINALSAFPWDSNSELVFLSTDHITKVLNRYLNGQISELEVESWANTIEGRDDIGLEIQHPKLLRDIIHELANPLLTRSLNYKIAHELLEKMATNAEV
jgi:hypothetical protein